MSESKKPHPTRLFNKPNDLKKVWDKFKLDLKAQESEWQRSQYVGREGNRVTDNFKVPMTFEGFKRYCRNEKGEVEQYFTNQDEYYNDFIGICRAIKDEIRENQIIGGLLNFYNASITQRLNNLTDKTETKTETKDTSHTTNWST